MSDRLAGALQENLLALLCFYPQSAAIVRNSVEPELFSSAIYREIVGRVYDFIDSHKKPPGNHLPDLLEDVLSRPGKEAELYLRIVESVLAGQPGTNGGAGTNESYVLSQLEGFVRGQRLKASVIRASEAIQEGNLDQAEVELSAGLKTSLQLFSPGMTLKDGWKKILSGEVRQDVVLTGIKELDQWGLGPARGELHILIGPPKRAKTWWLVNIGKRALISRLKVCHITLEISEAQVIQRYIQSLFSLMKSKARVEVSSLESDKAGRFVRFERREVKGRPVIGDYKTRKDIDLKLDSLRFHDNLLVKSFPSGLLSVSGLRAYLDALERSHNFIPDVLIVDYPDLMKLDRSRLREELGGLFVDLRGVATERNIVLSTVTQANRAGAEAKLLTDTHASEDFSKIMTADTVLTYSQTLAEKELGLARIFVSNTRVSDHDRFVTLIAQSYQTGQFCLDSSLMVDSYWGKLSEAAPQAGGEPE